MIYEVHKVLKIKAKSLTSKLVNTRLTRLVYYLGMLLIKFKVIEEVKVQ